MSFSQKLQEKISRITGWVKGLPLAVKIAASVCVIVLVAGIVIVACILNKGKDSGPKEDTQPVSESTEQEAVSETVQEVPSEVEELVTEVPYFADCTLVYESVKNDLTIYVEDENGNNITGRAFTFMLLDTQQYEQVKDFVEAIDEANQLLEDQRKLEGTEDYSVEEYKNLLIGKKAAIDAYLAALEMVESEEYKDEDGDGTISITNLSGGQYMLCYVPVDEYDVETYGMAVTIRDTLSYKAIETIDKLIVPSAEAGDSEASHSKMKVEKKKKDTVEYVDSVTLEESSDYSDWMTVDPGVKASVSEEMNVSNLAASGAELSINKSATIYAAPEENSVQIQVSKTGLDILQVTPDASLAGILNVDDWENGYEISVQDPEDAEKDVSGQLAVSGTLADGSTLQAVCDVKIIGSSTKLKASNGNQLYIQDKSGKIVKAAVGNYSSKNKYCIAQNSEKVTLYGWQTINNKQYYYDNNGKKVTGKQVINGIEYNFDAKGRLQSTGYGVDVSSWQGSIDWKQASAVIDFAMIRCGFRGTSGKLAVDSRAIANVKQARKNGVKAGMYFYSRAKNETQAMEEASVAVKTAKEAGTLDLPIYIDMEDSVLSSLSTSQRDAIVKAFCRTVRNSGYSAGVYASKDWLENKLTPSGYDGISVWCVQFNTSCTYKGKYAIWQFTSKGNIPGISGTVNLNK